MSKPISVGFTYGTVTTSLQLSQLDTNFGSAFGAINDFATYGNYLVDASGTPNQITVTIPAGTTFSYSAGVPLQAQIANTNTSTAVNINVSLLGNKAVLNADGSLPVIGQFAAGQILPLIYDGTAFRTAVPKLPTILAGTFTGTLTGCTTAPTATFNYCITGNIAAIYSASPLIGTSNSTTCTITGLPAVLTPVNSTIVTLADVLNNGAHTAGASAQVSGTILALYAGPNAAPFVNTGGKGYIGTYAIIYPLA